MDGVEVVSSSRLRRLRAAATKRRLWSQKQDAENRTTCNEIGQSELITSMAWLVIQIHGALCYSFDVAHADHSYFADSKDIPEDDAEVIDQCEVEEDLSEEDAGDVIDQCKVEGHASSHDRFDDAEMADAVVVDPIDIHCKEVQAMRDFITSNDLDNVDVQASKDEAYVDLDNVDVQAIEKNALVTRVQREIREIHAVVMSLRDEPFVGRIDDDTRRILVARSAALVGKSKKLTTDPTSSAQAEGLIDERDVLMADFQSVIAACAMVCNRPPVEDASGSAVHTKILPCRHVEPSLKPTRAHSKRPKKR